MMNDPVIKAVDAAPYACRSGIKSSCASHGVDYQTFLSKGYPLSALRASDCTVVNSVLDKIEAKRAEVADGQQQ